MLLSVILSVAKNPTNRRCTGGSFVALLLRMTGLGCHPERSEESYRRAVGNGPYKAGTHVSPRRGGNLPPAVRINSDPAAIVGSFVTSFLRMTGLGCHSERSEESPQLPLNRGIPRHCIPRDDSLRWCLFPAFVQHLSLKGKAGIYEMPPIRRIGGTSIVNCPLSIVHY